MSSPGGALGAAGEAAADAAAAGGYAADGESEPSTPRAAHLPLRRPAAGRGEESSPETPRGTARPAIAVSVEPAADDDDAAADPHFLPGFTPPHGFGGYSPFALPPSPDPAHEQTQTVTVANPAGGNPLTLSLPAHLAAAVASGEAQIVLVPQDAAVPPPAPPPSPASPGDTSSFGGFQGMLRQPYGFFDPVLGGLRVSPGPPSPQQFTFASLPSGLSGSPLMLADFSAGLLALEREPSAAPSAASSADAAEASPNPTAGVPVQLMQHPQLHQLVQLPNGMAGIVAGTVPESALGIRPDMLGMQGGREGFVMMTVSTGPGGVAAAAPPQFLGGQHQVPQGFVHHQLQPQAGQQPTMFWTIQTVDGRSYNVPGTAAGPLPEYLPPGVGIGVAPPAGMQTLAPPPALIGRRPSSASSSGSLPAGLQLPPSSARRTHAHRRTSSSNHTAFSANEQRTSPPSSTASVATSPALSHASSATALSLRGQGIPDDLQGFGLLSADPGFYGDGYATTPSPEPEYGGRVLMPVPELGGEMPFHHPGGTGDAVPLMHRKKKKPKPALGKADFGIAVAPGRQSASPPGGGQGKRGAVPPPPGASSNYEALFSSFAMAPRKRGRPRKVRPGESGSEDSSGSGGSSAAATFTCPTCDRSFNRLYNLKSHVRTHDNHRPFVCGSCGQAFTRNHDLTRHERVHSGTKPHRCDRCGKGFARMDALRRHEKTDDQGRRVHCLADGGDGEGDGYGDEDAVEA